MFYFVVMSKKFYKLFGTSIGYCGISWSEKGISRIKLPEASKKKTESYLVEGVLFKSKPPYFVENTINLIKDYFTGENVDFSSVKLDFAAIVL